MVTPNPAPNIVVKSLEKIGLFPFYEVLHPGFSLEKKTTYGLSSHGYSHNYTHKYSRCGVKYPL
jgi:hypothetical protein